MAAETVRTELTGPEPGVIEAGENEQVRFWGKPEQVKAITLLKAPDWGVAVTVILPDPPEEIVTAAGSVLSDTVALPLVPVSQFDVKLTGPEI